MLINLQKYISEELDEVGEVGIAFIIPMFLQLEQGKTAIVPILENKENYTISDHDFSKIVVEVTRLFNEFDLGLYRYNPTKEANNENKCWEDYFDLLSEEETKGIFSRKELWLGSKDIPALVIAKK